MTEHPLTDKMIQAISHNIHAYDDTRPFRADMRAAADWQLKQVIEWIKGRPNYDPLYLHSECRRMIADLKEAMRPQQQQEDN